MRFENLVLGAQDISKGIKEVNITRLGQVVAFFGKNGAGKTRILDLIENKWRTSLGILDFSKDRITCNSMVISTAIEQLGDVKFIEINETKLLKRRDSLTSDVEKAKIRSDLSRNISHFRTPAEGRQYIDSLDSVYDVININTEQYIKRVRYDDIQKLENIAISEGNASFETLITAVTHSAEYDEFSAIHKTGLSYLSKLPHDLVYDMDDCYGQTDEFKSRTSYKRYLSLQKLIKGFIGKDFTWEKQKGNITRDENGVTSQSKGIWKLDGREFDYTEFSSGEKTLFAYCLLFFLLEQNPNIRIRESIILIDEPELHLHPEMELSLINGIRSVIGQTGQLFIATHSLTVLSSLNHDEIFLVKNGEVISPNRLTPGLSLTELMGLDVHIDRIAHFITDISNWAYLNFMTQCFLDPNVIQSATPDDPQIELFKKSITNSQQNNILLDFGAGKGRLFKELRKDDILYERLQYWALEPTPDLKKELLDIGISNVIDNYLALPPTTFSYVVLCNVLHEIDIVSWPQILNKIQASLKNDGFLIIIEDLKLPVGEKIGEHGFIIMDNAALKTMFYMDKLPTSINPTNQKYNERIQCLIFNKDQMSDVTTDSVISALDCLKNSTLNKIRQQRKIAVTNANKLSLGRESAFYSQLYINCIIAQEKLYACYSDSNA